MSLPVGRILVGDALEVLRGLPEDSVHCVVTDPPYALTGGQNYRSASPNPKNRNRVAPRTGFMGNAWDAEIPDVELWAAVLRVMKPGAHMVAFGAPRTFHRLTCNSEDAGFQIRDVLSWLHGQGFPKSKNLGSLGTALKPAWEPIILARKPLAAGSIEANYEDHGTGLLDIDACKSASGRWPANVALDEMAAAAVDAESGERKAGGSISKSTLSAPHKNTYQDRQHVGWDGYGDSGGASRFFFCSKADSRDRGEGNEHPTVKPQALMSWLVKMVCPSGGVVLDPFAGSGTTCLVASKLGRRYVGIELNPAYAAMAEEWIRREAGLLAV
ncbi:DNA-methyltransferase [Desulfocurvus sp. DL9XJH121]